MLQFLQPIWLWALSAISIPIAIHFWNRRPGKIRKVGTIAFLAESSRNYARKIKMADWLLLALRILLFSLLAMLFAYPTWISRSASKANPWILVRAKDVRTAYGRYKNLFDSLMKSGAELRDLSAQFKQLKLKDSSGAIYQSDVDTSSYWNDINLVEKNRIESRPIFVFTSNELKNFRGTRAITSDSLRWFFIAPNAEMASTIENAYLTSTDSIRTLIKTSDSSATRYNSLLLSGTNLPEGFQLFGTKLSFHRGTPVEIDTSTIHATIFADKYFQDASYMEACLKAIQQYSKRKINVVVVSRPEQVPDSQKWLFWLSERPLASNRIGNTIFCYKGGSVFNSSSRIYTSSGQSFAESKILKMRADNFHNNSNSETLWTDGFGQPILSMEKNADNKNYYFFSRLNPDWNDLPWNADFPRLMYQLLFNRSVAPRIDTSDRRAIDSSQIQPQYRVFATDGKSKIDQKQISLSSAIWMILFFLFAIERIISFQNSKKRGNG